MTTQGEKNDRISGKEVTITIPDTSTIDAIMEEAWGETSKSGEVRGQLLATEFHGYRYAIGKSLLISGLAEESVRIPIRGAVTATGTASLEILDRWPMIEDIRKETDEQMIEDLIEMKVEEAIDKILKIQTRRFDIVLTSFLYVAGLTTAIIGLLKTDLFYSILGAIGIIGASFHIFSTGQRKIQ